MLMMQNLKKNFQNQAPISSGITDSKNLQKKPDSFMFDQYLRK